VDDEEVMLSFTADVAEAAEAIGELKDMADELTVSAGEAQEGLDGLRDSSAEAGGSLAEAGAAAGELRDGAAEAAGAAQLLADNATEAAEALGHLRDEAVEASAALHEARDAEAEAGAAGAGEGLAGISMMALAITALIGLIAGVAPAVLAAGLGIGAFAGFAVPWVEQVAAAFSDTNAQLAQQPWYIQQTVKEVKNLEAEWKGLSAQFAPELSNMASQVLGIASGLLPKLVPLAQAAAGAVQQLLDAFGRYADSKGFTDFLSLMTQLAGPAILAVGKLAGTILGVLGQAIEQLAPLSVPFITMLTNLLKAASPALAGALKFLAQVIMDIGKAITPVMGPLGKFFGYLNDHPVFAQIVAGIVGIIVAVKAFNAVMSLVSVFSNPWVLLAAVIAVVALLIITHTHQIAEAFDLVRHTVASWGHDTAAVLDGTRHDIAAIADGIADDVEGQFDQLRHDTAAVLDGTRHDIAAAWDGVRHDTAAIVDAIPGDIEKQWDQVRHDAAALGDDVLHAVESLWSNSESSTSKGASSVVSFFTSLPGRILAEIEGLPAQALQWGEDVVNGIIRGVEDAAAALLSEVSSLAGSVEKAFTDPLSIFSPSLVMYRHGVNFVQGAIDGVRSKAGEFAATVRSLAVGAGAQGIGGPLAAGAIAPAAGSSTTHVTVPVTLQGGAAAGASPQYLQGLQAAVQEAVLRYGQLNPGNGLTPAWGR
jgi:hypothetical protein